MYEDIKEQVIAVVKYAYDLPEPKVDRLIDKWAKNKSRFIKMFGDKLIYELFDPITFELDEDSKKRIFKDFVHSIKNEGLRHYLNLQKKGFFTNTVVEEYNIQISDNHTHIAPGTKLLKTFKYFISDKELLNKLQSEASMIIQQNKITGKLCLSVHPLDFLSSSENTYNWRSCHSLDGEFSGGNFSYMTDKSTIICYLKSASGNVYNLPNFPEEVQWNSKKWRMLVHFDLCCGTFFTGRQYPFSTITGMDKVKEIIIMLTNDHEGDKWLPWRIPFKKFEDRYLDTSYVNFVDTLKPLKQVVKSAEHSLQYNDVLHSNMYQTSFSHKTRPNHLIYGDDFISYYTPNDEVIEIGEGVLCLNCEQHYIQDSDSVICDGCYDQMGSAFSRCDCCQRRFRTTDGYRMDAGDFICPACKEEEIGYCERCGCERYLSDLTYVECYDGMLCWLCENQFYAEGDC